MKNKSKIICYGVALTTISVVAILTTPHQVKGEFDLPSLNQQVQHQQSQLDNHEARVTNLEEDTKKLQSTTGTQPAESRQSVPEVAPISSPVNQVSTSTTTSQPIPTPNPAAVLVDCSSSRVAGTHGYKWDFYENKTYQDGHIETTFTTSTDSDNLMLSC